MSQGDISFQINPANTFFLLSAYLLRSKYIVSKIYPHSYFDNITTLSPSIHVKYFSLKLQCLT